ncbi:unnamed protein product, partial [Pocillopora meandrina]
DRGVHHSSTLERQKGYFCTDYHPWQCCCYPEAVQAQFMPFSGSATIYVERKSGCKSCQGAWFLAPVPCDCLIGKHFGQRAGKRKRCKVCAYTKNAKGNLKHTKTNFYCAKCDAHLCEQPCFQKWHSQSSL